MNGIVLQTLAQPVGVQTKPTVSTKTSQLPVDSNFALLIGGLIQQAPQLEEGQALELDQLIEVIDQLLMQLISAGDEELESQFSDDVLESNIAQLLSYDFLPLDYLLQQFATLFGLETKTNADSNGYTSVSTSLSTANLGLALSTNATLLTDDAANVSNLANSNAMNAEPQTIHLQQQVDVLNQLRSMLTAAKDGQITLQQKDLVKVGELLQQIGKQIQATSNANRENVALDNKLVPVKNMPTNVLNLNATQSSTLSNSLTEQNLSQQSNQEQNPVTTKAGFHQMLATTQVGNVHLTSNEQTSEPVVRAQYVQKDLQDVVVRQLQMTRFPNGVQEAKIRLYPANLGSVEVKLVVQQGVVSAHFIAETNAGKELLDSQLSGLRASLISQGLQVDKLEVTMPQQSNLGQSQDALTRQGSQQHDGQQGHSQQQKNEDDVDFSTLFEEFSEVI